MTHSLYDSATFEPLLNPTRLLAVSDILQWRAALPDSGGIYGWWFGQDLPGVPTEETLLFDGHRLLYIGIAPRRPASSGRTSKSTLRRRITRDHLGGQLSRSTLRRSLAAILDIPVVKTAKGKWATSKETEQRLTGWMVEQARLSFMVHDSPWELEEHLLHHPGLTTPLNISGAIHGYRDRLLASRR